MYRSERLKEAGFKYELELVHSDKQAIIGYYVKDLLKVGERHIYSMSDAEFDFLVSDYVAIESEV